MIRIYQKKINNSAVKEISEFRPGSWIYVQDASEEDLSFLQEKFSLDPDILKDALDPYEFPRVEKDKEIVYIFTRFPQALGDRIITAPLLIAAGPDFVMTFSKMENAILDKFLKNGLCCATTQKTRLVLYLISEIIKSYNMFLANISRDVRGALDIKAVNEKVIINFVKFEEVLNDFFSALTPTNLALQNILNGKLVHLYKEDQDLMKDLLISVNQLLELCKSTLKNIVNVREAYSAIVTNDLNRVIKLLTSLTVILTIPTIIASFYGMNIKLPFENHPYAFLGIVGIVALTSVSIFIYFNKNKWL
ncbi:MAG: magnesium transporter CorA family protein [Candidatus Pacebacteria bacterium]|nr:magnesium transporter CorA family protein [Candidatus Paceibacterota bacterium]